MIIYEGWILLYRQLLKSEMWQNLTAEQRDLVIACLLRANHKEAQWEWKGKVFNCQPGEFITSLDKLQELCAKKTTVKIIRTGLKKLQSWGFLAYEGAKTGTKITIVNWGLYQSLDYKEGKELGKIGAKRGQKEGKIRATNNKSTTIINNNKKAISNRIEKTEKIKCDDHGEYEGLVVYDGDNIVEAESCRQCIDIIREAAKDNLPKPLKAKEVVI